MNLYSKNSQKSQIGQKTVKKASNVKNKTTLFYETLKVQTMKVVLFFSFEPFWTIIGLILLFVKKIKKIA